MQSDVPLHYTVPDAGAVPADPGCRIGCVWDWSGCGVCMPGDMVVFQKPGQIYLIYLMRQYLNDDENGGQAWKAPEQSLK